ncbi:MAG: HAD hydrolase-like protein [Candidatus Cloacimonetes bacterium]|nr:HAD hydrolase-like protein [Candidatus Cloacimonadota bacterium]
MDYNKIKILILDCDGVFTDGRIIYDDHRVEAKNFSAKDGMGIKLLKTAGIKVAMITGRESNVVRQRCQDLSFDFIYQGVWRKRPVAEEIMSQLGYTWENVAYMGDDWNDYPVIKLAGLSACPADTFADFQETVDYVCERKGGRGAIREFIEYLLKKQGRYQDALAKLIANLESTAL